MFKNKKFNIKEFLSENAVPVVFLTISAVFVYYSGTQPAIIMNDVVSRFARNAFFVLSLLFPVLAGMGLNFGIVVGAMAAQIGIYTALALKLSGLTAVLFATVVCVPFAVLFGFLSGWLNNKTKGQEMLTYFRMVLMAPFSSRDTCAWEIPRWVATSIWVLPS